jgi:two-component system, chemotaxis family, sensor kinase CheA
MSETDEDDIWPLFRDEATEALEELAQITSALSLPGGADRQHELEAARRILHNIKGAARIADCEGIEIVAHALEEALRDDGGGALGEMAARLADGMGLMARFLGGDNPLDAAQRFAGRDGEAAPPAEETPAARPPAGEAAGISGRPFTTTVRIEASRLDRLMLFVGEMVTADVGQQAFQAELERHHLELAGLERENPEAMRRGLRALASSLGGLVDQNRQNVVRFGHLLRDWSAAIKQARMCPLGGVVSQWRRVVAEAAHALGREASLLVEVGDIEIDRQVLDGLRDPMMHLLRNAVAHGIEPPDVRERKGKPRAGTVRVRARAPGMMVELEVTDDGAGFDTARIRQRAVEQGLEEADRAARMTPLELAELVFLPGLSTAESVTGVSGRGVGLDVVRQRLVDLGGSVRIGDPTPAGSTFVLEVPATIVSTKGLLLRSGRTSFVLPMAYVARTLRVARSEVREIDGASAVAEPGRDPLRLRWLASIMQEPRRPDPDRLLVVVVADGAARLGLVVEDVVGEIESVTKRLPWNVPRVPGVAGAMLLGTGGVAVVIDVPRLLFATAARSGERAEAPRAAEPLRKRRILVVDDSLTSRTLERNILVAAGYDVDTVNDGEVAWQSLQAEAYDLVVSDVQMPRLDGLELCRRIRAHPRLRALPVLLVTSLDRPTDVVLGSEAGADEYIVKGRFDQKALLEAVARHL